MKYYNDKKYYVNRALRIAKRNNFQEGISSLTFLKRQQNVFPIDFIKRINKYDVIEVDLFNIESSKLKDTDSNTKKE